MSSALAQELPDGMACIALNPGIINTEMLRKCWAEGASVYQKLRTDVEAAYDGDPAAKSFEEIMKITHSGKV